MDWKKIYTNGRASELADGFFREQKETKVLNGWFRVLEIHKDLMPDLPAEISLEMLAARKLKAVAERLPLSISDSAVFAGTQNDAFSSSYALIHPSFKVEEFKGYCDPLAVFGDLGEEEGMTPERINLVKDYYAETDYVRDLKKSYEGCSAQTEEALFFVEQVTGHLIPDFSRLIREGSAAVKADILAREAAETDEEKKEALRAMHISLEALEILAGRYRDIAAAKRDGESDPQRRQEWELLAETLDRIPGKGAENLYQAIQFYILCWQTMCIEQSPNPYAFSAGNIDRLFRALPSERTARNAPKRRASCRPFWPSTMWETEAGPSPRICS